MLPLSDWPTQSRRNLVGVFTDIDDTLTTEGAITPDALQALADLQAAGLLVITITGRPIGWCAPFALGDAAHGLLPWPVDAMVAENGAAAYAPSSAPPTPGNFRQKGLQPAQHLRKQLSKRYQQDAATRVNNQMRMQQVAAQVLREVPQATLTRDAAGRECDLAFDYNEHAHLPPASVQQMLDILQRNGMHTSVSSIHVHGCFGDFNKWTGACWIVQQLLQRNLAHELDRWVFVGDSGNDQPMFQHFIHSVGVANVQRFAAQMQHLPRYVAQGERGAGFAEVAAAILVARKM